MKGLFFLVIVSAQIVFASESFGAWNYLTDGFGQMLNNVSDAVQMKENELAECEAALLQTAKFDVNAMTDRSLGTVKEEHSGHFVRSCTLGPSKSDALNNYLAIKDELTQVNTFGDRSENRYTVAVSKAFDDAAFRAHYLSDEAKKLLQSNTIGIASFKATYHEDSPGPPPQVHALEDSSIDRRASVGDIIAIQGRPSAPWPFFVKIASITDKVGNKTFTDPQQSARAAAQAMKTGEALSFEIQARPTYDPTHAPPVHEGHVGHFYSEGIDAQGHKVSTTITWKVTLDPRTGTLSVSASGDHEFCNLDPKTVETNPLLPSARAQAALNVAFCEGEWNGAQDLMWQPFTRSFLKQKNGNYKPGISAEACVLTIDKTVGAVKTRTQSVPIGNF